MKKNLNKNKIFKKKSLQQNKTGTKIKKQNKT
jgi:hypothetical protein